MSAVNIDCNTEPLVIKLNERQSITVVVNKKGEVTLTPSGNPVINLFKPKSISIGDNYNISVNSFEF